MIINSIKNFGAFSIVFIFFLLAYGSDDSKSSDSGERTCEESRTITEIQDCITGTWVCSRAPGFSLDECAKIVFNSGGSYELYTAKKYAGAWPSEAKSTGTYKIEVERYSDGAKYHVVILGNSGYRINFFGDQYPHGTTLEFSGTPGGEVKKGVEMKWID